MENEIQEPHRRNSGLVVDTVETLLSGLTAIMVGCSIYNASNYSGGIMESYQHEDVITPLVIGISSAVAAGFYHWGRLNQRNSNNN